MKEFASAKERRLHLYRNNLAGMLIALFIAYNLQVTFI